MTKTQPSLWESLEKVDRSIVLTLRKAPVLTEFEIVKSVSVNLKVSEVVAMSMLVESLERLRAKNLVWYGTMRNGAGQSMISAAVTRKGKEI